MTDQLKAVKDEDGCAWKQARNILDGDVDCPHCGRWIKSPYENIHDDELADGDTLPGLCPWEGCGQAFRIGIDWEPVLYSKELS